MKMNWWQHVRMNGYSEDLRRRIVFAVERGMPKIRAAHTFCVSLSSVERYVNKADRGESLSPKKNPNSTPKLDEKAEKLLADALEERPCAILQEHHDCIEAVTGLSVSRAIARRIGSTRKKGTSCRRARRVLESDLAGG